ncbi:MAG: hypothetical protein R6V10_07630 [bacterium]
MTFDTPSEIIFNLVKHHLHNAPDWKVIKVTVQVQKGEPAGKALSDAGFDPSTVSCNRQGTLSEDPDKTE